MKRFYFLIDPVIGPDVGPVKLVVAILFRSVVICLLGGAMIWADYLICRR